MAPKTKLSADDCELKYAAILRDLGDVSAFKMRTALLQRRPKLDIAIGVLDVWITKFRLPAGAVRITSQEELEAQYGDKLRPIVPE